MKHHVLFCYQGSYVVQISLQCDMQTVKRVQESKIGMSKLR